LLSTDAGLGPFPSRAVQPYITGQLPFLPLSPATRITVAQPVQRGGQTIGIIEVSADGADAVRQRRGLLLALLPAALLAVAGAMLMASLLARNLLRPLAALRRVAATIAAGDLHARADERRPDEIGRLAAEINRMAAELEARFAEVERLASARREFYRSVSHDLRTPLTAIRGIAENLEDSVSEQDRASLVIIQSETERLGRLVDDLLAGNEPVSALRRQPLPLMALVQEVVELMRPRAERGGVRLVLQASAEGSIAGDRDRLKQALVNLLDNALKWTPAGGSVRVTLAPTPASTDLLLSIADSGPGIPTHLRSTLWQRGTRGADGGQGLGLAQVQQAVTAHGGTVRLAEGPGTTIELRLPTLPVQTTIR
jgi:signal transduction histidine kinase